MPLRFDLGPGEKLYIGRSILTNGQQRCCFVLDGDGPVLRGKDVIVETERSTTVEKLYCCIQNAYLEHCLSKYENLYATLLAATIGARQISITAANDLDNFVKCGQYYKALRQLKTWVGIKNSIAA